MSHNYIGHDYMRIAEYLPDPHPNYCIGSGQCSAGCAERRLGSVLGRSITTRAISVHMGSVLGILNYAGNNCIWVQYGEIPDSTGHKYIYEFSTERSITVHAITVYGFSTGEIHNYTGHDYIWVQDWGSTLQHRIAVLLQS